jgi:DNA excision repair protein ERCC-2
MPTGTGKTITLLSLITSYQLQYPETTGKLIYCTRTVPEMTKCMAELKVLIDYRRKEIGESGGKVLGLCLSSRKNMCIHTGVLEKSDHEPVDAQCRKLTASWVRGRAAEADSGIETCGFYEEYDKHGTDAVVPEGVYAIDDLKELGRKHNWCPYFLARHMISYANVIVYNYQYMLDPKVSSLVSKELEAESIVVFDEAHNIDNVCIEAYSVELNRRSLDRAAANLRSIGEQVDRMKRTDSARLNAEYRRLVSGLAETGALRGGDGGEGGGEDMLANPVLSADVLAEAMPGNIRQADHFVTFLKRVVEYLKQRIRVQRVEAEKPLAFLHHLHKSIGMAKKDMKRCYDRLNSLLKTLEITDLDRFVPIIEVADFTTLVATYDQVGMHQAAEAAAAAAAKQPPFVPNFSTHLLTYSLTHLLTYSLTHLLTYSLTHLLIYSST